MSKRLSELLRQRAQLQEHLAWLDREIASEQDTSPPTGLTVANPTTPPASLPAPVVNTPPKPPPPLPSADLNPVAEKIIGQYQQDLAALGQHTRKGCLWFFGVAMGAAVGLALIAYALYARHLGRWW